MTRATIDRALGWASLALLAMGLALVLAGCESRADEDRRQETANSAATVYEAATAIEQGADQAEPLRAIKANASAIATAQGHPYPPPQPENSP